MLTALVLAGVVWLTGPAFTQTQDGPTAAERFQATQAKEAQLTETATVEALRLLAREYQNIPLLFPTSVYCDNALWQAGQLLDRAWQKYAQPSDRDAALKVYRWLAKSYPGALAREASARVDALAAAPSPAAPPATTTAAQPIPTPAPALPSGGPTVLVRGVTRSALPNGDRVTVELSDETTYAGQRVSNPDRVFFDFANAAMAAVVAEQVRALQSPLIKTVRVGNPTRGVTRVVLELVGAPRYSAFQLYSPYRVVIDLEAPPAPTVVTRAPTGPPPPSIASKQATQSVAAATPPVTVKPTPTPAGIAATPTPTPTPVQAPVQTPIVTPAPADKPVEKPADTAPPPIPPSSTGRGEYSLTRQLGLGVSKIVIDPGHGGHDPGAMSNGVTEAELVLDCALRLEKLLQQIPGVEVVLTRRTNEFVPLEERTAIANRAKADLFLSIHANSHKQPAVSGIETYFLNFTSNPDAAAVAARENASGSANVSALPGIVKAIYLNDKIDESREFATVLQNMLVRRTRGQSSVIRDLGVKQAPFVVLIGATMPSVLTEIGFITNKTEANLVKQPAHRQLIAQALRDAIVKYQDSLKRVAASSSRKE